MTDQPAGKDQRRGDLRELFWLFTKLGFIAFGGPAAHIAMMRDEVVVRRRWLTEQEFLDLVGITNLIPGPNSTQMGIHVGRVRAGWRGLIVAGVCFIVPAALITLALAVLYVEYGSTPQGEQIMYGIAPVIIAIIIQALWGFFRTAVKDWLTAGVGVAAFLLYFLAGVPEIPLLLGGALTVFLVGTVRWSNPAAVLPPLLPVGLVSLLPAVPPTAFVFLTFLKIGSVLFGSGYVLLAFLRSNFVDTGLLTDQQILDAVAVGQFTPGPVFTAATFVGYLMEGVSGAAAATFGIFIPAFVFVALISPFIPRLRSSPAAANLLDGVNVAALALMAAVTLQLGLEAVVDPLTAILALGALLLLLRFNLNSAWLVLGGGLVALASQYPVG